MAVVKPVQNGVGNLMSVVNCAKWVGNLVAVVICITTMENLDTGVTEGTYTLSWNPNHVLHV